MSEIIILSMCVAEHRVCCVMSEIIILSMCVAEPPESDVTLCKAFQYCGVSSKSIEINYENMDGEKILTKVNFQLSPAVRPWKERDSVC